MSLDVSHVEGGAALKLTLNAPKGNVLDGKMIAALREAVKGAARDSNLRAVVIDAAGKDFSWGASVEEHRPEQCAQMLASLHGLIVELLELPLPVLVAVQGRCLGGGLELALAGSRLFAAPTATLGQPEIKLGVFAPAGSALLADRVGPVVAEDLLLTGRTLGAQQALEAGLVDVLCADGRAPVEHAVEYVAQNLSEPSRTALRFAVRAARLARTAQAKARIAAVEKLYVEELMKSADAKEGIASFIEKRPPKWTHELPK